MQMWNPGHLEGKCSEMAVVREPLVYHKYNINDAWDKFPTETTERIQCITL